MRNLRANRLELDSRRLQRTRELMDLHVAASVVTGHLPLIPSLTLPDRDDRHVLAAAIHCQANLIVTKNLKDFPEAILTQYAIKAQHFDPFLLELLQGDESAFCSAVVV